MATELLPGYCALCISRCGCVGTVRDGVLTRADPDPLHPTGQALCVKAKRRRKRSTIRNAFNLEV